MSTAVTFSFPLATENVTAVDIQDLARHIRCHGGGKKQDRHSDFFRSRKAAERYAGVDPSRLAPVPQYRDAHVGIHPPWRHTVHPDAVRSKFCRESLH